MWGVAAGRGHRGVPARTKWVIVRRRRPLDRVVAGPLLRAFVAGVAICYAAPSHETAAREEAQQTTRLNGSDETGPSATGDTTRQGEKPRVRAARAGRNLVGHGGPIHAIRVDRAGRRALTGSFDYAAMLWDLQARPPRVIARLDEHDGWIKAVAFLPDGKRALTAGGDGKLYLWRLEGPTLITRLNGHLGEIADIAMGPEGRLAATASRDRSVRVWDLATHPPGPGPVLRGHQGPVNAVQFSASGKEIYSASYDGTIRLWDAATGAFKRIVYRHGLGINVLARLPGSEQLVFGAVDGRAGVIDGRSGRLITELKQHAGPILSLALIAKPGLVALGSSGQRGKGGTIRVWRMGDWKLLEEYDDPYSPIWALAFVDRGAGLYYGGLNDFAVYWQVSPRKPFELAPGRVPRRFQVSAGLSLGARQFARKCSLCHTLEENGRNRAGPTLFGLFGRRAGSLPGYPYSQALKSAGIVWSEETVAKLFSLGPEHYVPGSKMPLQRISDPNKVKALVAFLKEATRPEPEPPAKERERD